jgi:hypothetical protein
MIKVVDAEVIYINKILKYSEKIFSLVTHLLQALLASAPINNCYEQSCACRVIFIDKKLE